jgi:DNA-binding beta-propeller fold protein YncE
MTPDDKYLLVGIMGANYVEVIDWRARKTIRKIITDKAAHNFLPRGDGRHVFVSNRSMNGSISLVDMQTLTEVEKYDVPGGPDDMGNPRRRQGAMGNRTLRPQGSGR